MQILPIQRNLYQQRFYKPQNSLISMPKFYSQNQTDSVSFKGGKITPAEFEKAKKAINLLDYSGIKNIPHKTLLNDPNLGLCEGIQYGIKIFEGLNIKQILNICNNLSIMTIIRGCNRMCGHCFVDAKPTKAAMSYEDFHDITTGFKTLRERFATFDIFGKYRSWDDDVSLFLDADCIDMVLKDKSGKEYDFIDLSKELYESLWQKTIFDTCGWHRNDSKPSIQQKRAEKYAQYYSKPENLKPLTQFNVSINPFNATYIASIKNLENGNIKKAQELKDRYIDDMVNVLFTFTPVSKSSNFGIIVRALPDRLENTKYFNEKNFTEVLNEIMKRLEIRYKEECYSNKNVNEKIIKNEEEIEFYLNNIREKLFAIETENLFKSGRMVNFMNERNIKNSQFMHDVEDFSSTAKRAYENDIERVIRRSRKLIGVNGDVFCIIDNPDVIYPTNLKLNIDGKNISSPVHYGVLKDCPITIE